LTGWGLIRLPLRLRDHVCAIFRQLTHARHRSEAARDAGVGRQSVNEAQQISRLPARLPTAVRYAAISTVATILRQYMLRPRRTGMTPVGMWSAGSWHP
jgi:hypothetical protein